jgi:hypothetical protein
MKWTCRLSAFLSVLVAFSSCSTPRDVSVSIDVPVFVSQGQEFAFVCTVANKSTKPQKLLSLDVAEGFLKGIVIHSTQPPFVEAMRVPIFKTMSYSFDETIEPGETLKVVFKCYAAMPGDWNGEVYFFMKKHAPALIYPVRTIVK